MQAAGHWSDGTALSVPRTSQATKNPRMLIALGVRFDREMNSGHIRAPYFVLQSLVILSAALNPNQTPLPATSIEHQIVCSQTWSTLEDSNDATITKPLIYTIFVELETTLLLIIEEVDIQLVKLPFDHLLIPSSYKGSRAIDTKANGTDFQGVGRWVEASNFIY